MSSLVLRAASFCGAALVTVSTAIAQPASIVPYLVDDPEYRWGELRGIAENGTVAGYYSILNKSWALQGDSAGAFSLLPIINNPSRPIDRPTGISADGRVIVGETYGVAGRWIDGVGSVIPGAPYESCANGVSADGETIVGFAPLNDVDTAFYFRDGALNFLPNFGGVEGTSEANDVSDDGTWVVGKAMHPDGFHHAFRWSFATGMQDLGTIGASHVGNHAAFGVSPDGQVVVGQRAYIGSFGVSYGGFVWTEATGMQTAPNAHSAPNCVTNGATVISGGRNYVVDGEEKQLLTMLNQLGVSTTGYFYVQFIHGIDFEGSRIAGSAEVDERISPAHDGEIIPILITLPPLPTIKADEALPPVIRVSAGQTVSIPFSATGPDGRNLTFAQSGLPPGATLSPLSGSVQGDAFEGNVRWTPTAAQIGSQYDVRLYVRDVATRRASLQFKLEVIDNRPPTVQAPLPVAIECTGGETQVELQALVNDPDGDSLDVDWIVNGVTEKSETLAAGTIAKFESSYPDGETIVTIQVSDGDVTASEQTSVTVQDTTAPLVVVAPGATLGVELGEIYASSARLAAPVVSDVCDEAPSVVSDAPQQLPIGVTFVTWTVEDASGNVAQAVQRVKVVNQRPIADAGPNVQRGSRGGRVNVRLDGRGSSDPDAQELTYFWRCPGVVLDDPTSARPRGAFPVGVKFATLVVTDAAGARSKDLVRIKVVAESPVRGRSPALRRTATEAYELASEAQSDPTTQLGLQAAGTAIVLNEQADAQLRLAYESDDSGQPDLTEYFVLRGLQAQASGEAAAQLFQAYQRTGDDRALKGAVAASRNGVEAMLDLTD